MELNWEALRHLLVTWKYFAFGLFACCGWGLLSRNRPIRQSRLLLQGAAVLLLGGIIGLLIPWVSRTFGLHPSPVCAFGKGIAYPIVAGRLGHPMILLLAAVIVTTLVGAKAFCGWACPIGAIQELIGRIPGLRRHVPPFRLTNSVRVAAMLLFFILLFAVSKISYDYFNPFKMLHWSDFGHPLVWAPFAVMILASLYIYRPFCAFLCPIGLLSWLFERFSFGKIRIGTECDQCGVCLDKTDCQALPALVASKRVIPDCHGCGDCLGTCPKEAISWKWRRAGRSA